MALIIYLYYLHKVNVLFTHKQIKTTNSVNKIHKEGNHWLR